MQLPFTNRTRELEALDAVSKDGGLIVVFGRRRVGKTRLLTRWIERSGGFYSQAIEAAVDIQIGQVVGDLAGVLPPGIHPRSWVEFFELLALRKEPAIVCLDEFPYLTATDPSLPSVIQKWMDHRCPEGFTLVLSGSSTSAMNACFLNRSAPLYQRARKILAVRPMNYRAFCDACNLPPGDAGSFVRFSLVGGIPKYWEFVRQGGSEIGLAEELYFGDAAYLEDEPARILKDEKVGGIIPLSVLEAVGRGAAKTSEIAGRLGTAQTNLGRVLQQLMDASILSREIPFGESLRSTKRSIYKIADPAISFWFHVYSPHRTTWRRLTKPEKTRLLRDHASAVFEDWCRSGFDGAARLWDSGAEFDLVREVGSGVIVGEVKFKKMSAEAKRGALDSLRKRWEASSFARRYPNVSFEILDVSELEADAG